MFKIHISECDQGVAGLESNVMEAESRIRFLKEQHMACFEGPSQHRRRQKLRSYEEEMLARLHKEQKAYRVAADQWRYHLAPIRSLPVELLADMCLAYTEEDKPFQKNCTETPIVLSHISTLFP